MAWPFSRLTSYVATTVPAIKAADLNAIQDALIGVFAGTLSRIGIVLDGTGNLAVTPKNGGLTVLGDFTGTTTPTTDLGQGVLSLGNVVQGWARVSTAGALVRGHNVRSVTKIGVGNFKIVFNWQPTQGLQLAPLYSVIGTGIPAIHECESGLDAGYAAVNVRVFDAGTLAAADRIVVAAVMGV